MINLRRILCPIDFSDAAAQALRPAASLASEYGADLILLHVLDHPYPGTELIASTCDVAPYYEVMEDNAGRHLEKLIVDEAPTVSRVEAVVRRGTPATEIARLAKERDVDLIVVATSRLRNLSGVVLGTVANRVVRLAGCPVLTIPPQDAATPLELRRILHPTDFSDYSDHALPYALAIAERHDAELVLLHVATLWDHDPANPAWRFPPMQIDQKAAVEEAARESLEARCVSAGNVGIERRMVRGFDPPRDIAEAAETIDADMIVMATHGHTGLKHLMLGSTAEKVVRHSKCPVLTVKHPEHEFVLPDGE